MSWEPREIIDRLLEEWYVIKTIDFEDSGSYTISEELQCPNCESIFYAHTTTIRNLVNHVIDHLAEQEAKA